MISTLVDRAGVSVVFVTETAFVVEETVEVCCVSCFVDLEASEVIRFSRAVFDVFILGINQAEKESLKTPVFRENFQKNELHIQHVHDFQS